MYTCTVHFVWEPSLGRYRRLCLSDARRHIEYFALQCDKSVNHFHLCSSQIAALQNNYIKSELYTVGGEKLIICEYVNNTITCIRSKIVFCGRIIVWMILSSCRVSRSKYQNTFAWINWLSFFKNRIPLVNLWLSDSHQSSAGGFKEGDIFIQAWTPLCWSSIGASSETM